RGWRRDRRRRPAREDCRVARQLYRTISAGVIEEHMSLKRRIGLMCVMSLLAQLACADFSNEISESSAPIGEGVPEVALVRLQALLNNNLPEAEWRAVVEKLAEAQIAAKQPENALVLLADSRVRELSWAKFWRAQAFASLDRWGEALPLYEQLANEEGSRFRTAAIFGTAEMLRALGRRDVALKKFTPLIHDKEWATRARLRAAELYIETGDATGARRLLEEMEPSSVAERRERRVLRGRLELMQRRPERAIGIFQGVLKRPEGAAHSTLIAAVFGVAEAQVQLKTPEIADDVIEQFIDRHPADPNLPLLFARLDELYREEHKPSRNELERWVRSPEQPRRTFARWYLARFEIRAGRRERARQLFTDLRRTGVKSQAIAPALLEFAKFEVEDKHFDEAIAILNDARSFHPAPSLLTQMDFLSARAQYLARRFGRASEDFEQIARSGSPWAKVALFNASTGWLQLGDHTRFLTDYRDL